MTVGLITLVATLIVSLLITRIGSVALTLTGLASDVARFQARSAYTGVGFATQESEQIVNHPVRRRIVATLMLTGNIGIAVVIASMMATFAETATHSNRSQWWIRVAMLMGVLALLWIVGTRKWVDQTIERVIAWALRKWTTLDVRDYVSLLHLGNEFVVFEIKVKHEDWVAGKTLAEAQLTREGILVLGIHRGQDEYIGSPNGRVKILTNDILTVYGPRERLEELDLRKRGFAGDRAHESAVEQRQADGDKQRVQPYQSHPDNV